MPKKKLLVFLSHASEDKPTVRELHKRLSADGFDPWLDEQRLLPGQDWNLEIEKALRQSDKILLCFSRKSSSKDGYIQKECKRAMTYQLEKPEGSIFVIPVRLDDCDIPFSLRELQYVDYPSGYKKLIFSLNVLGGKISNKRKTSKSAITNRKKVKANKGKENLRQVQLVLEGTFEEFNQTREEDLISVLATVLRIDSESIRILEVHSGSIIIVVEMPRVASDRLIKLVKNRDFHLKAQRIASIQVEGGPVISLSTDSNNRKKIPSSPAAMQLDYKIQKLTPYRYLDSLDTVRYKYINSPIENGVYLHAYSDILLALIMGEGITVPDNQLVDSPAFIDVASQLIEVAKETHNLSRLNLKASLYKSESAFQVAADIFGNVGNADKEFIDRYVLSSWPFLDTDPVRRSLWAARFKNSLPIPDETKYIKHPEEFKLVNQLFTILSFFDSPEGVIKKARQIRAKEKREEEIRKIALLNDEQIFSGTVETRKRRILSEAILVIKKLVDNLIGYDDRSKVVNTLMLPDQENLNPFYFESLWYPQEVHDSVLTIIHNIYNFTSAYAVKSTLASLTAKAGSPESHFPAIFGLSAWSRLVEKAEHGYVLNMPNGEIAPYKIRWDQILSNSKNMSLFQEQNFPWKEFFIATTNNSWRESLYNYFETFKNYKKKPADKDAEFEKIYQRARYNHLSVSSDIFPENYLTISRDKIILRKTGLFQQIESSVSYERDARVVLSNQSYAKQGQLFRRVEKRKGKEDILLQIEELERQYEEQLPETSRTISGLIAAFKENIY